MTILFQREIDNLKKKILAQYALVEENLWDAVRAFEERNVELAQNVEHKDEVIDEREVDLEEDCLKILALYQPVALDLRFIIAVLKMNNDLERIGDLAVNISEQSIFLADKTRLNISFDFFEMAEKAEAMVKKSLTALIDMDADLARRVCAMDDELDDVHREMYVRIQKIMRENSEHIDTCVHLLSISKSLERVGDHATNIAEDIIYMVEGEIVRHRGT